MDPLAEKYYPISPYAYVANNPIIYIDPDGREIWLYQYDEEGNRIAELQYTPGMEYDGDNAYFSNSITTLNQMNTVEIGGKLLNVLHGSKNVFGVTNKDTGVNNTKGFLPNKEGGGELQMGENYTLQSLAHEMFHGYQQEMGQGGKTAHNEIEAMLYAAGVSHSYIFGNNPNKLGSDRMTPNNNLQGQIFSRSMTRLLWQGWSSLDYLKAVSTFFEGYREGDFYKQKGYIHAPSRPLIKDFYPLIDF